MSGDAYHIPVMLQEAINGLQIDPNGVYVDVTFGGGGHSMELLKYLDKGRLLAFDQDPEAAQNAPDDPRFSFIPQNFRYMRNFLRMYQAIPANGILADLGVSSHQFDEGSRGFSLRNDAPLDMRMNPEQGQPASALLDQLEEDELTRIFRDWGEIPKGRLLARKLIALRGSAEWTTGKLKEEASKLAPRGKEHKFLAQVFQALRIEVNDEMAALKEFLEQCSHVLKPGGRLVVISYHSLEDRLVKHFMRSGNFEDKLEKDFFGNTIRPFKPLSGKALVPTAEEITHNPRSRSARLRIAERLP